MCLPDGLWHQSVCGNQQITTQYHCGMEHLQEWHTDITIILTIFRFGVKFKLIKLVWVPIQKEMPFFPKHHVQYSLVNF